MSDLNRQTEAVGHDLGALAEHAQDLISATANVAGDRVGEARKRLAAVLDNGKVLAARVRDQAVAGAKIADKTVRENPYQAIAISIGVGAVIGYLIGRRNSGGRD